MGTQVLFSTMMQVTIFTISALDTMLHETNFFYYVSFPRVNTSNPGYCQIPGIDRVRI